MSHGLLPPSCVKRRQACGNSNRKNPTTVPMVTNPTEDNVTAD